MTDGPLWITEAEVAALLSLAEALAALRVMVSAQGAGEAHNIPKALGRWDTGAMHCLGAMHASGGVVGWKTWAIIGQGGAVTYELFDAQTGRLRAVIEAAALGQLRTAAMTGLGTDLLAPPDADSLAIIGAGRQALAQVAAILAVRRIRAVRVYSRDPAKSARFADTIHETFGVPAAPCATVAEAVAAAAITTLVTRAEHPFLTAAMLPRDAHLNAVGAILPTHAEFTDDVFDRVRLIGVDSLPDVQRNSREFRDRFGTGDWSAVHAVDALMGPRADGGSGDLTLFKSMGMGLSDLAVAAEVHRRAIAAGVGRPLGTPVPAPIRWS